MSPPGTLLPDQVRLETGFDEQISTGNIEESNLTTSGVPIQY